ncbi:malate dehydrogenase, cytoplasmic-like [Symsagittifera roscoffensis]|uniref:malate dehydrogenase, cytoplasmic-like n=1 Tax=Symsagittifera roscoffensis TaxID=84072 RepID=UPI00307C4B3B
MSTEPLNVCVTGAAGQIAYSLIYIVAKGEVFGKDQPINLILLDIQPMMGVLEGVVMEIQDCAFPLVKDVVATADPMVGFKDCDSVFMLGAMPRREGMERKDLLKANCKIFEAQGAALDKVAKKTVKVLVVGNPANTNALICSTYAPSIPKENITAMTRLDQNRATGQVAAKIGVTCDSVKNMIIWGNHSGTQFPDAAHATATVNGESMSVYKAVNDDNYLKTDFVSTIQQRGAAVIKARKLSSAMSAAKAACDHMRDWWMGTPEGEYVSMAVYSAKNSYGIDENLMFSFPCTVKDKTWTIVSGLTNDFTAEKLKITEDELKGEREMALGASV